MNLINIEKITKSYTDRKLFDQASFSLQEGEKIGIIGINGTGKTTLLKMIAGLEEPDKGTITQANHIVIRYLPQHPEFESEKSSLQCVLEGQNEKQYQGRDFHQEHPSINDKMAKVKLDQILQMHLYNLDLCSRNFLEFLDEL